MNKLIVFLLLIIASFNQSTAQLLDSSLATSNSYNNHVGVRAKATSSEVMLKWTPLSQNLWLQGLSNGYTVTRKKLGTDNQVLSTTSFSVSKKNKSEWTSVLSQSYFDVLYQSIFDDSTQVILQDDLAIKNKMDSIFIELKSSERAINTLSVNSGGPTFPVLSPLTNGSLNQYYHQLKLRYNSAFSRVESTQNTLWGLPADSVRNQKIASLNVLKESIGQVHDAIITTDPEILDNNMDYGLTMVYANLNFEAAEYSGIALKDNSVDTNTRYRYVVKPNNITQSPITAGFIEGIDSLEVITSNYVLPTLPAPTFTVSDSTVEFKWDGSVSDDALSGFFMERKAEGQSQFTRINTIPIISFNSANNLVFHVDRVENATKNYTYRLIGSTYFNQEVISPEVIVSVKKAYLWTPAITSLKSISATNLLIKWKINPIDLNPSAQQDINRFKIQISANSFQDNNYLSENILASDSTFIISKSFLASKIDTTKTYYYKLIALTNDGKSLESLPFIKTYWDRTPPSKPLNLRANRLSGGAQDTQKDFLVSLTWNANTENDLYGYKVLRKLNNTSSYEKIVVSGGYIKSNSFVDSLSTIMGYPELSYYVVAVDSNYFASDTASVTFTKPDDIAPLAPFITDISVNKVSVRLMLNPSVDSDVESHLLFRKKLGDADDGELVNTFSNLTAAAEYLDNNLLQNTTYIYWIYAVDFAGNVSCLNPPDECFLFKTIKTETIRRDTVAIGLFDYRPFNNKSELTWSYQETPDLKGYEIYRSTLNTQNNQLTTFSFLTFIPRGTFRFKDKDIDKNYKYQYGIRAIFTDGSMSEFTMTDFDGHVKKKK